MQFCSFFFPMGDQKFTEIKSAVFKKPRLNKVKNCSCVKRNFCIRRDLKQNVYLECSQGKKKKYCLIKARIE